MCVYCLLNIDYKQNGLHLQAAFVYDGHAVSLW